MKKEDLFTLIAPLEINGRLYIENCAKEVDAIRMLLTRISRESAATYCTNWLKNTKQLKITRVS